MTVYSAYMTKPHTAYVPPVTTTLNTASELPSTSSSNLTSRKFVVIGHVFQLPVSTPFYYVGASYVSTSTSTSLAVKKKVYTTYMIPQYSIALPGPSSYTSSFYAGQEETYSAYNAWKKVYVSPYYNMSSFHGLLTNIEIVKAYVSYILTSVSQTPQSLTSMPIAATVNTTTDTKQAAAFLFPLMAHLSMHNIMSSYCVIDATSSLAVNSCTAIKLFTITPKVDIYGSWETDASKVDLYTPPHVVVGIMHTSAGPAIIVCRGSYVKILPTKTGGLAAAREAYRFLKSLKGE